MVGRMVRPEVTSLDTRCKQAIAAFKNWVMKFDPKPSDSFVAFVVSWAEDNPEKASLTRLQNLYLGK